MQQSMNPRWWLIALAGSYVVSGLIEGFLSGRHLRAAFLLHGIVIAALCYSWCRADGLARGILPTRFSALFAGLFPLLGIPFYLFRSRPARAAWISTGKALLFVIGMSLAAGLVTEVVHAIRA